MYTRQAGCVVTCVPGMCVGFAAHSWTPQTPGRALGCTLSAAAEVVGYSQQQVLQHTHHLAATGFQYVAVQFH